MSGYRREKNRLITCQAGTPQKADLSLSASGETATSFTIGGIQAPDTFFCTGTLAQGAKAHPATLPGRGRT